MMLSRRPELLAGDRLHQLLLDAEGRAALRVLVRLLAHLDAQGYDAAWPVVDPDMPTRPLLDFGAGYVQRSLAPLPKQGPAAPWLMSKDYQDDVALLRGAPVTDEHLHLGRATSRERRAA